MVTENLWGERWSKLVTNVMGNGLSACTGLISREVVKNDAIRHFSNRLGSEAIRVGQALGYTFDEVSHMDPETLARAGEGDPAAQKKIDDHRLAEANRRRRRASPVDGPGHGQGPPHRDPLHQRLCRAARARRSASTAPTNAILTDIVTAGRDRRIEARPEAHHRSATELDFDTDRPSPAVVEGRSPSPALRRVAGEGAEPSRAGELAPRPDELHARHR